MRDHMINRTPVRDRPGAGGGEAVVPRKLGMPGGGKGPVNQTQDVVRDLRFWGKPRTPKRFRNCRRRYTRKRSEAGDRFYALYDKHRDDILRMPMPSAAPTKARRASTARILRTSRHTGRAMAAELALALRQETYRRSQSDECLYEGQRQTQALGISSVRDRVCMTAALLVLEPIFRSRSSVGNLRLPRWRNAQQAVVEWRSWCSVAPDVVTPTRGLLREHSAYRPPKVGGASDR